MPSAFLLLVDHSFKFLSHCFLSLFIATTVMEKKDKNSVYKKNMLGLLARLICKRYTRYTLSQLLKSISC